MAQMAGQLKYMADEGSTQEAPVLPTDGLAMVTSLLGDCTF